MWPYRSFDKIAMQSDTFVHWCSIVGAVIFALNMVFIVMLGAGYNNERKRHFDPMGSSGYVFWSPLTLTLAILIGGPFGGVIGWYIGTFVGGVLAHFGMLLLALGAVASIVSSHSNHYRRSRLMAYTYRGRKW